MLVLWRADTDTVQRQIRETRALRSRPVGVNLNLVSLVDLPPSYITEAIRAGAPQFGFTPDPIVTWLRG